jgi:hypothetical protein
MTKNNTIINFDCIPENLQRGFLKMYESKLWIFKKENSVLKNLNKKF